MLVALLLASPMEEPLTVGDRGRRKLTQEPSKERPFKPHSRYLVPAPSGDFWDKKTGKKFIKEPIRNRPGAPQTKTYLGGVGRSVLRDSSFFPGGSQMPVKKEEKGEKERKIKLHRKRRGKGGPPPVFSSYCCVFLCIPLVSTHPKHPNSAAT